MPRLRLELSVDYRSEPWSGQLPSVSLTCGLRHVAGPKAAGLWNHFGPQRVRREGRESELEGQGRNRVVFIHTRYP